MPRPEKWTLADRLDFEALVVADEREADPAAIAARDTRLWHEQIAPTLTAGQCGDRRVVFRRWLEARRGQETLPGKWFTAAWYWFNAAAIFGGVAMGFAVASGALYYAGAKPVNIAVFLAVTVGVQWILLLWSLAVILSRGVRTASQRLLARLGESIGQALASATSHLSGEQQMRLRGELATLRQISGRNLQPLGWAPLVALQNFGVFWNYGVLFALLARVMFTDVAFGWESTVAQSPDGMYAIVHALATPWRTFGFDFCPTLQQVQQSWFHYQSGVSALDRTAMASWWPWLLSVVLIYGLVPRKLLSVYFQIRLAFSMRRLSFDEPRHRAAWHRLTGPLIQSNRPPHEGALPRDGTAIPKAAVQAEVGCVLVASSLAGARTEIEQWVTRHLGWRLAFSEMVEIDYPSGNDDALARFATALPQAPCWLVVVPAPFTAFSAFTQFLARVGKLAESTPKSAGFILVIALDEQGKPAAPDVEWARYWSDFLRAEATGCATLSYTP